MLSRRLGKEMDKTRKLFGRIDDPSFRVSIGFQRWQALNKAQLSRVCFRHTRYFHSRFYHNAMFAKNGLSLRSMQRKQIVDMNEWQEL